MASVKLLRQKVQQEKAGEEELGGGKSWVVAWRQHRCSSFLDRNGGQVRLYAPKTQEEESGEDIKPERWSGGRRDHDFN